MKKKYFDITVKSRWVQLCFVWQKRYSRGFFSFFFGGGKKWREKLGKGPDKTFWSPPLDFVHRFFVEFWKKIFGKYSLGQIKKKFSYIFFILLRFHCFFAPWSSILLKIFLSVRNKVFFSEINSRDGSKNFL